MELFEYGELLSILIPSGAEYVAMDSKYIMAFDRKPTLVRMNKKTYTWRGANCLGWTKYWKNFIDMEPVRNPDDKSIDWLLTCEKVTPRPWTEKKTLQEWAELLDRILPYDSYYATVNHNKLEMWAKVPFYKNGQWVENGGRLPHATFYVPKGILLSEPVAEYKFKV